jgi:uncharacterized membrane protein
MTPYWILIAIIPPILWAAINHADKYSIERFMEGRDPGSLIITTGGSGFLMFLVLTLFAPVSVATASEAALMIVAGFLLALSYVPYMYALGDDEASNVAPLFQLITPLVFVLAFIFLHETIRPIHALSGGLIILGALILSVRFETAKFKWRSFFLMTLTALMIAANVVIFKATAIHANFLDAVRYDLVGVAFAGLALFVGIRKYRTDLYGAIQEHGFSVLGFNTVIEITNIGARIINGFASLLVPATLVQFVNGFQPVFIVFFGILLSVWFPKWGMEALDRKSLIRKCGAVLLMAGGLILLAVV